METLTNLELEIQLGFPGSVCSLLIALLEASDMVVSKENLASVAQASMPEAMLELCSKRSLQVALVHLLKERVAPMLPHLKTLHATACKTVSNDVQLMDLLTLDDVQSGVRVNENTNAIMSFSGAIKLFLKTGIKNPLDNTSISSLCFVRKEQASAPVFPPLFAVLLDFDDLLLSWIDELSAEFTVASALDARNQMFDDWNSFNLLQRELFVFELERFASEWNVTFPLLSTFRLKLMLQTSALLPFPANFDHVALPELVEAQAQQEEDEEEEEIAGADLAALGNLSHLTVANLHFTVQDVQELIQEALHFLEEAQSVSVQPVEESLLP